MLVMDRFRKEGDIKLKIFFNSPRPLIGEGEGERVKKCKSKLESNRPLSLTLSHGGERGFFLNWKLIINN